MTVSKKIIFLFILFLSSTIYTTKIAVSPAYFGAIALFFFSFLVFIKTKRINITNILSSRNFLLFATTICAIHSINIGSRLQDVMNFVFGPLVYIAANLICSSASREALIKASILFIRSSLVIFSLEFIFRITLFDSVFLGGEKLATLVSDDSFYNYKFASFMYEDSNYVGLQLVALVGFMLGINAITENKPVGTQALLIAWILIVGTLSRASMAATMFILLLYHSRNFSPLIKSLSTILAVVVLTSFAIYFSNDESFQSKFGILLLTADAMGNMDWYSLLFGIGIGKTSELIGVGAHSLFVLLLIETGILYLVVFSFFVTTRAFRNSTMYIVVGFLLNGFSLATFAIPYLYLCLAISERISKKQK